MKTNSLILVAALVAALHGGVAASEIIYQTGFESPESTPGLPLREQDGWLGGWFSPGTSHPTAISTVNARDGAQCVRFDGADAQGTPVGSAFAFRPIFDLNDPNAPPGPLMTEIQVDARLNGPQTGSLGTPQQDVLSANLEVYVLQPNGFGRTLGGFFVSSAGKIWTFGSRPEDAYKYSLPYVFGTYHRLMVRVDFVRRQLTYFVDGVELGSAPIAPEILSEKLISGYLWLVGGTAPINTPELTYNRADYTAYFDNYSIASVPLTPADMVVQLATTDYAVEESAHATTINVIRRGYTNSAVNVTMSRADGTATAGKDYRPGSTMIEFAPGETIKTAKVRIKDDSLVETDETVMLTLNTLSPGVALSRSTAPLWVLDDERAGSADPKFDFGGEAFGITTVYEAPSIAPLWDGKFLATVFGEDASHNYVGMLARFKESGSLDNHFEPYSLPYGTGPSQITPILGGLRLLVNLGDHLVRLKPDGREDTNFNVLTAFGPDLGYISDVVVQPDLKIIIAGFFDSVNGVPRNNIARLRLNGEVDTSFDPGAGTDDFIIDAALQRDGRVLIGGYFQNVAGQPRPVLARLNKDGSLDSSLDLGAGFGDSVGGFPYVQTIAVQRNGRILAGGSFDSYQGATRVGLVRLLPDGALDASFDTGSGFESGFFPGSPGFVGGLALQPDGKVLVSGGFGYFNGVWATGIVRLNKDGALDTAFRLGGTDSFAAPLNGGSAITLLPDGDILTFLSSNVSFIKDEPVKYQGIVLLNGDPSRCEKDDK